MDTKKHFNLLLDKYKIRNLYDKFIKISIVSIIVKESFYWALIYFSFLVKQNCDLILKLATVLLILFGISAPVTRYFTYIKSKLIKDVRYANTQYFNERISKMSKTEMLNFDLVEYFNVLENFNMNLEEYINHIKNKYNLPIKCITFLMIAVQHNYILLIGFFAVFYSCVRVLNERKFIKELNLTKKYFKQETIMRNYVINSKNLLINNEYNVGYSNNNSNKFEQINRSIDEINHVLELKVDVLMFIFICVVIWTKIDKLTYSDFFYYFLIIYDIEFISDKINEYYKNRVNFNKMSERLKYLYSFTIKEIIPNKNIKIDSIKITDVQNENPYLKLTEPLIINKGDHFLVSGESGSGKTSLLYILKGILEPDKLIIEPKIENIINKTFMTLPNHKSLYNGKLHDIMTNYSHKPNVELINYALKISKINHKFNKNNFVNIEKLSGGERIRLLIARLIYTIKTNNYDILLFDEIDENLNDELAYEICKSLQSEFKDKIMLYITHNEKVKKLFNKKIIAINGVISQEK